jgi:AcrR family transcriptional regulator
MSKSLIPNAKPIQKRKRLTHEQSKAQTRGRLLEVGRQHILQHGLGGAAAERIAEDAGYSRGAFYGNFTDKDDLFLAIVQQDEQKRFAIFQEVLQGSHPSTELLALFRSAFADRITDPTWIILQAEFEAGGLRSEKMRLCYVELHQKLLREGREALKILSRIPNIRFALQPNELLLTMLSFSNGLAVNQRLLGPELRSRNMRKLIYSVFDRLVMIVDEKR